MFSFMELFVAAAWSVLLLLMLLLVEVSCGGAGVCDEHSRSPGAARGQPAPPPARSPPPPRPPYRAGLHGTGLSAVCEPHAVQISDVERRLNLSSHIGLIIRAALSRRSHSPRSRMWVAAVRES